MLLSLSLSLSLSLYYLSFSAFVRTRRQETPRSGNASPGVCGERERMVGLCAGREREVGGTVKAPKVNVYEEGERKRSLGDEDARVNVVGRGRMSFALVFGSNYQECHWFHVSLFLRSRFLSFFLSI